MLLRELQNLLSALYRIDLDVDVHDFLVTDADVLRLMEQSNASRSTEEKLLVSEYGDELHMSLYLDPKLLERLGDLDPRDNLGHANLADFCKVLEGISHFNYMAWNAAADKSVTLMEMELQAEVDKYIVARVLLANQPHSTLGPTLYDRLFAAPMFDPALAGEEYDRYRDASTYAGQYCRTLEKRFPAARFGARMMQDARTFYRLPQPEKLSHIQAKVFA